MPFCQHEYVYAVFIVSICGIWCSDPTQKSHTWSCVCLCRHSDVVCEMQMEGWWKKDGRTSVERPSYYLWQQIDKSQAKWKWLYTFTYSLLNMPRFGILYCWSVSVTKAVNLNYWSVMDPPLLCVHTVKAWVILVLLVMLRLPPLIRNPNNDLVCSDISLYCIISIWNI